MNMSAMYGISRFKLLLGILSVIVIFVTSPADGKTSKACLGTSNGLSHQGTTEARYKALRDMYTNCTYVEGNLEIVFLEDGNDYNLTFLSDIEEVSGYILIFASYASYIPLSSLRIIRGTNVYIKEDNPKPYSLYVAFNYMQNQKGIGLKQLGFSSLNEILAGSVFFFNNRDLCYDNTIYWKDILSGEGADFEYHHSIEDRGQCGECDVACHYNKTGERHCWGDGPQMCQRLNRVICSPQCDGRCYGYTPQECCHRECAGGCDGPLPTDCWACLHFDNGGKCEAYCPPAQIYNQQTYQMEPNPDVKYSYGSKCVEECPDHLVQYKGACIQDCGHGMMIKDKKCVECDGPCPKTCELREAITSVNIVNLTECTVIKGSIIILQHSFEGDAPFNITPMAPSALSVLESVKEVTGHVRIQGQHEHFKDLAFLRNLRIIHGRVLDDYHAALQVVSTSLEALNLQSLEQIHNGKVLFIENRYLCYAELIEWSTISEDAKIVIHQNADAAWCQENNRQCHPECSYTGCWGPGDSYCLECRNYHMDKICLENCNSPNSGLYDMGQGLQECARCNQECRNGCSGDGPGNCTQCKHVRDGPFCKNKCPESKYPDSGSVCQSCHPNCEHNCTGPRNILGEGGCNQCALAMVDEYDNITECLPGEANCPDGFYKQRATSGPMTNKHICKACHEECKICSAYGVVMGGICHQCLNYKQDEKCVTNCSSHYFADNLNSECVPCDDTCTECHGPLSSHCIDCRYYKLYWDPLNIEKNPRFNCTDKCPEHAPIKLPDYGENKETVCVAEPIAAKLTGTKKVDMGLVIGLPIGAVMLLGIVAIVFGVLWKQRVKSEENKMKLKARMSGLEESEPLKPTDAKPDMATLRLIKESELRRGNIIGSGAFGTVYKGFWIPEGETVKIPVAIKVLQEGTSPSQNKELLEEARIMASVYHPCCIRILAVCMTTQMMLITQLMPLGCLLEYVRKNKMNIGSKVLLNWCTQIARGMSYLEERAIVHRDLAARNVLVQSPGQVKITDFGLAKLLDYDEDEFHAAGGKMPIKWLALECIQHRIFTHKSDVWSFGVTIWELCTYGQRPYESVRARDIPDLLEKGERLPQPSICTIDVYMIMIKCWMLDADSRPSFKELADEFAKMARDPGRYLVIHGDKLMRLPSHNQDTKDILRSMSIASDTPDDFHIVEADDYLQPRGTVMEPSSTSSYPGSINGKLERIREDSKDSSTYDDRYNTTNTSVSNSAGSREGSRERDYPGAVGGSGRREKKYSGLEAAAAARRQRETAPNGRDSFSSRYCSDPCKMPTDPWELGAFEPGFYPDMPAPPTPIESKPPVSLDLRLPVDEDDYLQPKSTNPRAYMDLVDGPDFSDENSNPPTCDSGYASKQDPVPLSPYLDMSSPVRTAIDNPEYYDRNEPEPPGFLNINIDNVKNEKQPHQLQKMDSAEYTNPDHEYYNDYGLAARSRTPQASAVPTVYLDRRSESMV